MRHAMRADGSDPDTRGEDAGSAISVMALGPLALGRCGQPNGRGRRQPGTHTAHSMVLGSLLLFETLSFLSTSGSAGAAGAAAAAAEAAAVMAPPPASVGASAPPTTRALMAVAWSQLWPLLAGPCCSAVDASARDCRDCESHWVEIARAPRLLSRLLAHSRATGCHP
jgi:hypothetical protein